MNKEELDKFKIVYDDIGIIPEKNELITEDLFKDSVYHELEKVENMTHEELMIKIIDHFKKDDSMDKEKLFYYISHWILSRVVDDCYDMELVSFFNEIKELLWREGKLYNSDKSEYQLLNSIISDFLWNEYVKLAYKKTYKKYRDVLCLYREQYKEWDSLVGSEDRGEYDLALMIKSDYDEYKKAQENGEPEVDELLEDVILDYSGWDFEEIERKSYIIEKRKQQIEEIVNLLYLFRTVSINYFYDYVDFSSSVDKIGDTIDWNFENLVGLDKEYVERIIKFLTTTDAWYDLSFDAKKRVLTTLKEVFKNSLIDDNTDTKKIIK